MVSLRIIVRPGVVWRVVMANLEPVEDVAFSAP